MWFDFPVCSGSAEFTSRFALICWLYSRPIVGVVTRWLSLALWGCMLDLVFCCEASFVYVVCFSFIWLWLLGRDCVCWMLKFFFSSWVLKNWSFISCRYLPPRKLAWLLLVCFNSETSEALRCSLYLRDRSSELRRIVLFFVWMWVWFWKMLSFFWLEMVADVPFNLLS